MDGTYDQTPASDDDDDTFGNDVFGRDDFGKDKPEEKPGSGLKQFFGFDMDGSSDGESKPLFDFSKFTSPFTKKKEDEEPSHTADAPISAPADGVDVAAELRKYKALLDDGIITQEEFDAKKKQLLGL
ncbi:MAG: SHOCT domain-containing protein [Lachnospiraceae bacterium]|nr:SHOCT domain-containing protein [Lachnospiraceae bacterium]